MLKGYALYWGMRIVGRIKEEVEMRWLAEASLLRVLSFVGETRGSMETSTDHGC